MILLQFNFNCATQWHYGLLNLTSWGTSVTPGSCESCRPKGLTSFFLFFLVSSDECMKQESQILSVTSGLLGFFVRRIHEQLRQLFFFLSTTDATTATVPPPPQVRERLLRCGLGLSCTVSLDEAGGTWSELAGLACLFKNGWSRHEGFFGTPAQIRTMACKTHIQTHLLLFLFSFFFFNRK